MLQILGTGLSSCKESWHDGYSSCQRLRGKLAKLDCTNTTSMNVVSLAQHVQEAIQEETVMVHTLNEVLQYVDSERFTNMR